MTTAYDVYDVLTGSYLRTLSARIGGADVAGNEIAFDASLGGGYSYYYCQDALAVAKLPQRPTLRHTFNPRTKQWEDPRTLQDLKDAKWVQIKQARTQSEYSGFIWDGSTFDSDATSQNRITGAVVLASASPSFSIDWILADNTTRPLSQADMLQVGAALGFHVAAQFAKGVLLRASIDAAMTQAEVEAVVWW